MSEASPAHLDTTLVQEQAPSLDGRNQLLPSIPGYEVLSEIGRGGMGVVLKARQVAANRLVAVKMVLPGALPGSAEVERFRTEAEATANLRHPNIVRVYEVGERDGCPYFTMDFIDGPSLSRRLYEGPLAGKAAARMLLQIGEAIRHAHDHQVLHRDLKPSNILLDSEDRPYVADFGLAKHLGTDSGQTRTGVILGTPSYMAPEQALGSKELTPSVDVYGLGAILYEMLTGRPPFRAESPLETVRQVIDNDPAPPRLLNPNIERDLEKICLKCLEKDPARRYDSVTSLGRDLRRFLDGEAISARSLNVRERIGKLLERSQHDVEFADYGTMLFWLAGIILATEILVTVNIHVWNHVAGLIVGRWSQILLMAGCFFWFRRKSASFLPTSSAERLMWSVWIGYFLGCWLCGVTFINMNSIDWFLQCQNYVFYSLMTGLAFFSLGSSYWGWCYGFGAAFFLLALAMSFAPTWAPLEFGLLWAVVLVCIGVRLRRLTKKETEPHPGG
jgi:eukaryotic-like serine/threonine-protein kinase